MKRFPRRGGRRMMSLAVLLSMTSAAFAAPMPDHAGMDHSTMPGMDHPHQATSAPARKPSKLKPKTAPTKPPRHGMNHGMSGHDMKGHGGMRMQGVFGPYAMTREASGTSWQPDAADHAMLHMMSGDWMLMGHVMLTGVYDSQSGPRGGDKTFLAGMVMGAARRDFGDGDTLNFRAMLSPDPFMGKNGYPLLLATGETANGTTPLIDRQHPHDLFMELSTSFSHRFDQTDSGFLYLGYPGEPALGPTAFMHRASSMDIPEAPITHHWLDSTHITFGVVTAGFVHDDVKLEVSQFTGREPDQDRYDFDPIKLDSTAVRVSWNPDASWSLQTSWGFLKSPEELEPSINENRVTASATYVKPLGEGSSLAATLAWGEKMLSDGTNLNGTMLETEYKPADLWTLFARAEWEENDELVASAAKESVAKLSLGVIHDWRLAEHWKIGLGGAYDFVFVPSALNAAYGSDPHGTMIFTRITID